MINKHNPDVLSCLANLSNDEVFTPPEVVNRMLDMLPQELFESTETTFLDPCCKTGVFLREIAKRLLANQMPGYEQAVEEINAKKANGQKLSPDEKWFMNQLQHSIDHIFHNQLFGIAITEMTSLVSRRSVYCSKWPNGEYSVSKFDNPEGNIRFKRINHTWVNGKCKYCEAKENLYSRGDSLESHAYEWIHTEKSEGIFNMKFDVIIGNPPYHLGTSESSAQATPLYDKFVDQSKRLLPRYLVMIVPGRWYAGGIGLENFRQSMLSDARIRKLVDYPNAGDCFVGVQIRGGVCYFLWDRDHQGPCEITNISGDKSVSSTRTLNEYPVFVRWNKSVDIIKKVESKKEKNLTELISSVSPFGLPSSYRGKQRDFSGALKLHSSQGISFIENSEISSGQSLVNKYKVLLSRPISGNMETPPFKVIALLDILKPKEVCTHTYLVAGGYNDKRSAENLKTYLETKFVRFLLSQSISGMDISKEKFRFVPLQDFSKSWTDVELYKKYKLTQDEINFIESMIRPMDKEDA